MFNWLSKKKFSRVVCLSVCIYPTFVIMLYNEFPQIRWFVYLSKTLIFMLFIINLFWVIKRLFFFIAFASKYTTTCRIRYNIGLNIFWNVIFGESTSKTWFEFFFKNQYEISRPKDPPPLKFNLISYHTLYQSKILKGWQRLNNIYIASKYKKIL